MVLLLVAVALGVTYLFQDKIGTRVFTELTKQLKVDIRVKKVNLSLFSGFPEASVNLNDVELEDTRKKELLKVKQVSFRFSMLSLLGKKVKINAVVVKDGTLNIALDKKGNGNYDILKSDDSENKNESANFAISLKEARFENVLLRYQNLATNVKVKTLVDDARFSGEFTQSAFILNSDADLFMHYIASGKERYLEKQKINYDAKIKVNLEERTYGLEKIIVQLNGNEYILDGTLDDEGDHIYTDLLLTLDDASLTSVIQLIPEEYSDYFKDFSSKGKFNFDFLVKGKYSSKGLPSMEMNFGMKDGEIRSPKLKDPLKNVSFDANYTNGQYRNAKTSVFEIKDFKGVFASRSVALDLLISDFNVFNVNFELDGDLPLEAIYGLFDSSIITDGSGEIKVKDFKVVGRYEDMISMYGIKKVQTSGVAEFEDASLVINDEVVAIEEGQIILDNNMLKVEGIEFSAVDNYINLDGTFFNVLPVLFADANNTKRAELEFDASLKATKLDLSKLIELTKVRSTEPESYDQEEGRIAVVEDELQAKGVQRRERITNLLKGEFTAEIDAFSYEKIEAENFKGQLEFEKNVMRVKGSTDAMDGSFDLDGKMYFTNTPYLEVKVSGDNVDIKEFFRQSNNFGQTVLVDENLSGRISSKMLINVYFDQQNNFLSDKLSVLAGVDIQDGYLKDFKMLETFSDYIKKEDLREIKFTGLRNWLEISRGRIYLPAMFIQNNAMNLDLGGEYTFNNDLDFNLKLNAAQVFFNSIKKHNKNLIPQPAKRKGFGNVFFKIHGNIDDIKYEFNSGDAKNDLQKSEHRSRAIRKKLRDTFGDLEIFKKPQIFQEEEEKPKIDLNKLLNRPEPEEEPELDYIEWEEDSEGNR